MFKSHASSLLHQHNVTQRFLEVFQTVGFRPFCSQQCFKKFLSMFTVMRIEYEIRLQNMDIGKDRRGAKRKRTKL